MYKYYDNEAVIANYRFDNEYRRDDAVVIRDRCNDDKGELPESVLHGSTTQFYSMLYVIGSCQIRL